MRLHEAIEKAGEGGKIRKENYDNYDNYAIVPSLSENNNLTHQNGDAYVLGVKDITADDWEIVADDIIEVGDVVIHHKKNDLERIVLWTSQHSSMTQYKTDIPEHIENKCLTLIRKGKRHVFEGVRNIEWIEKNNDGSCTDSGKKYRMTLEEVSDGS